MLQFLIPVVGPRDLPAGLKEIRTEQVQQVLQRAVVVASYCQEDEQVHNICPGVFLYENLSFKYGNKPCSVQKFFVSCGSRYSGLALPMLQRSQFQPHLYHVFMIMKDCKHKKLKATQCNYSNGMPVAYAV